MTSRAEERAVALFQAWNARLPTTGDLAFAAFWLAVATGPLLAIPYDSRAAADSLQLLALQNPAGLFVRALHYWSGQVFLIFTVVHLFEHLARQSEHRVRLGVWVRLGLSLGLACYLMVSGYILRGEAEGSLAREILSGLLERLPLLGTLLHPLLVGPHDTLQLLYLHHAATATILTLAVVVEHFRRAWPSAAAWLAGLFACAVLALVAPPSLHDGASAVLKGPWYMLGVQELLHWLAEPALLWLPASGLLVLLLAVPLVSPPWAQRARAALLLGCCLYLALTVVGAFFRGANWEWQLPGAGRPAAFDDLRAYWPEARVVRAGIPVVLGRREGCLACHGDLRGFEPSHAPEAVGCASCHLGRPFSGNAALAHVGMPKVPGNLDVARATCGGSACHAPIVERVDRSLMANGAGLVGVNRFVFGETSDPDGGGSLRQLGASSADRHLDDLCAGCHLAVAKPAPGPIDESSRGGGCTACHLNHDPVARQDRSLHPTLTLRIGDDHCFGCHSRSGRISTSYAGWHETQLAPADAAGRDDRRLLADGRVFERRPADVHHEAGLACVDCHTSRELMGDGREHRHQEEALEVGCADCHFSGEAASLPWSALDEESRKIVRLRSAEDPVERRFLTAARSGLALVNAFVDSSGRPALQGKLSGRRHPLNPPSASCTGLGHERLSCGACHTDWAPQCLSCHTQQLSDGSWQEFGGDFLADPPSLGVRGEAPGRIATFAPGMILTVGTQARQVAGVAPALLARQGRLQRLFAPVEPHTTARRGRSCRSCHAEPLALGVGRGGLRLVDAPAAAFVFEPAWRPLRDGLPADAWTAFLGERTRPWATRSDARPLSAAEQKRILRVGACLECHPDGPRERRRVYADFARARRDATARCLVPWPSEP